MRIAAGVVILAVGSPTGASAAVATDPGYSVSPPKYQLTATPGETITGTLRIFTRSGGMTYRASVGDATQDANGQYLFKERSKDPRRPGSWLDISPTSFTSGPGTVEPIQWTMAIPKSAEPGDAIGVIYVTQATEAPAGGGFAIQPRLAVRIEVRIRGKQRFQPVITSLKVPKVSSSAPVKVTLVVVNKGNVRIDMDKASNATLAILSGSRTRKTFRLTGTLFPNSTRRYSFTWHNAPSRGKFTARARLEFDSGKQRTAVRRSTNFYIAPYRLAGALALTLLGVGVLVGSTLIRRRKGAG